MIIIVMSVAFLLWKRVFRCSIISAFFFGFLYAEVSTTGMELHSTPPSLVLTASSAEARARHRLIFSSRQTRARDLSTWRCIGIGMHPTVEQAQEVLRRAHRRVEETGIKVGGEDPFLTIATAARYLRGYKSESVAAKNMASTFQYRKLVQADNLGTDYSSYKTVWTELEKRSMFLASKSDGQTPPSPVLILRKRGEAFDKKDFEEYRRAFFFTLECTAKIADTQLALEDPIEMQTGQWVIVMDMDGYSSKNSPPLSVSLETLRIFQNHFPERAKRIVILDAPNAFNILWRILSPFIDGVTREKFIFLSRSEGHDRLKDILGDSVWNCVQMDLQEGKETSAQLMIDAGLLRPLEVNS